jgi:hypothetical protein
MNQSVYVYAVKTNESYANKNPDVSFSRMNGEKDESGQNPTQTEKQGNDGGRPRDRW